MDGHEATTHPAEPARQAPAPLEISDHRDFFISYSQVDRSWAEWIAWNLEEEGHTTIVQDWDCLEGMDFFDYMVWARRHSKKTIAVLSDDYFGSPHCMAELKAAYAADPTGKLRLLVLLRARNCTPDLLTTWVYADLFGKTEPEAQATLLRVFGTNPRGREGPPPSEREIVRRKPEAPPPFPGGIMPGTGDGDESAPLRPKENEQFADLFGRLLNSYAAIVLVGMFFVTAAYFLGSKAIQQDPEHAYWDRMFNFVGSPNQYSEFGFGPGLLIEIFRMMVLLFIALIAMPMFSFRDAACRLLRETPARRLLGIRDRPPDETMPLEIRAGFLILIFFSIVAVVGVAAHHFYQGPQELWRTHGYRDEKHKPKEPPKTSDEPGFGNPEYRKRCLIPYLFYSVYSLINYMVGATLVLTISIYAGIADLLWMFRWTSSFRRDCHQGGVAPVVLHRRFETRFLVPLGEVLERYYALLVFLLTGFAFKVWLDRINLSPRAYEFELYALVVATVPVIVSYLVSTVFHQSAMECAAQQAQNPAVFRRDHRMQDFYGQSIIRSIYFPISLLLLATMLAYLVWALGVWLLSQG